MHGGESGDVDNKPGETESRVVKVREDAESAGGQNIGDVAQ